MKIPNRQPVGDFRAWLAWRLRVWAGRLEPERPHVMGPFPGYDGRLAWMAMQGHTSLAGFETVPTGRQKPLPRTDPTKRDEALLKELFPERTEGANP
ncbi:hypothetical protein [Amycolatopsis orientalis]|uniref:hypothetical protein n=1 Tax=Amycolatopsis orientalis TaxID=31958 RepID=UPI000A7202FA|nr:hypothetical protein [Amycolatopsis orientalis]